MALVLKLSRQSGRFIKTLPPKQYKQVVSSVLGLLNNPEPHDSKLLKGSKDKNRRADVGEYRIVYRVEGDTLLVLIVGKRNDDEVYKLLKRLWGMMDKKQLDELLSSVQEVNALSDVSQWAVLDAEISKQSASASEPVVLRVRDIRAQSR